MSVAAHLGVGDPDRGLLGEARRCWPAWAGEHPSLGVVADLVDLQGWTYSVGRDRADEVLHTLAMLASPSGGDDTAAAGALAWALLPGACGIAWRLQQLSDRIDETVAAELWVEVRSFPWQRLRKVAANILLNTRRGVLLDLGVSCRDRLWSQTLLVEPGTLSEVVPEVDPDTGDVPALVELAEVMRHAVEQGAIAVSDRDLLIDLAVAADEVASSRQAGCAGLFAGEATERVARTRGICGSTVHRRAKRAMAAVAVSQLRESA